MHPRLQQRVRRPMGPAWAVLGLALAGLAGCDLALQDSGEPIRGMQLLDGAVVVQAPDGYCIDQGSSRPLSGFVVMAGCALVSEQAEMPFRDGLVTFQVGGPGTAGVAGSEEALRSLLSTAEGVSLLSSNGNPTTITVDALDSASNLVTVHFFDMAPPPFDGLEQFEWRAFFDLGDRISTVTVRGFDRAPMTEAAGIGLLRQTVRTIQQANVTFAAQMAAQSAAQAAGQPGTGTGGDGTGAAIP
jgi:hypothetical protein